MADRTCSVMGCERTDRITRGMCAKHYRYWLDHTPHEERPPAQPRLGDFWSYVYKPSKRECWVWTGKRNRDGYGLWGRKYAHRASMEIDGQPPGKAFVLHRCDNPPCVNPTHLYLGTPQDNMRDAIARGLHPGNPKKGERTHCDNGHEFAGTNLIIHPSGGRICRICDNKRKAASARRTRRRQGVAPRNFVTPADEAQIESLRRSGASHRAIVRETGRSLMTVQRVLRERGL